MTGGAGALGRIALGTVQFGTAYGVSNRRGRVSVDEVRAILADAAERGVDLLDTAATYGEAEAVLGRLRPLTDRFRIVTKALPLGEGGIAAVEACALGSLTKLGRSEADGLLVHRASDLRGREGEALWRTLRHLQERGLFRRLGISAYAGDDPLGLAERFAPEIMQLPVSFLDQRLVRGGTLEALAARGIEVHARSVFLQGLVFLDPGRLPTSLAHAGPALAGRARRIAAAGASPLAAGLHFALRRPEIDRIVVGLTSLAEWRAIAAAAAAPAPELDWEALALDDPVVLDPGKWQSAAGSRQ